MICAGAVRSSSLSNERRNRDPSWHGLRNARRQARRRRWSDHIRTTPRSLIYPLAKQLAETAQILHYPVVLQGEIQRKKRIWRQLRREIHCATSGVIVQTTAVKNSRRAPRNALASPASRRRGRSNRRSMRSSARRRRAPGRTGDGFARHCSAKRRRSPIPERT